VLCEDTFLSKKGQHGAYRATSALMVAQNRKNILWLQSRLGECLRLIIHTRFTRLPVHAAEFISVNYVYSGHLTLRLPDKEFVLHEGQFYLMNAEVTHSFEIAGEEDIILGLQLEREFLSRELLYDLAGNGPVASFLTRTLMSAKSGFSYIVADYNQDDKMKCLFEDLFCEFLDPSPCRDKLVENYIQTFFILLMRCQDRHVVSSSRTDMQAILKYIQTHCASCNLEQLAQEFHYNAKYLSALIKKRTGYTFGDLITAARMEQTCHYLRHSALSVQEIASLCGYTNLNFFYTKFRQQFGMTPTEFRATDADIHTAGDLSPFEYVPAERSAI
ncbi:MAG: AraC family transcriptional regulator, partial [Clostridiales bacterium]|nr:AraC family transcriptional regulator [Clostridiales bacterium]